MPTIQFDHVSVYYKGRNGEEITALNDFSCSFEDGTVNAIIGYSGSGKTTLLNCLTGKVYFSGHILSNGQDIEKIKVKDRKISYVNQEMTLYPGLTVYENIAFPLKNEKLKYEIFDRTIKSIAEDFGIALLLSRKPKYISIGQASRVCIARSLVKNSELFLFDEPLSHLDLERKEEILGIIKENIKKRNGTALYVTHNIKEALRIADHIYILKDGKLYLSSTSEKILDLASDKVISDLVRMDA